ncbi:hypothetical protein [Burkholderia sp. S171]|uniref:hypothetical protein n=1 Tax=Burkholderia sp. S171 TaxID=1641860 RepID=UPI00131B8CD4|nr:hypothetical protein [Burkholderia sp. S171]
MLNKSRGGPLAWKSTIRPDQSADSLRFVTLDLASDSHARAAIEAYADSCAAELPWLADILRARLEKLNRSVDRVQNRFPGIQAGLQAGFQAGLQEDEAAPMPLTYCEQTARRLMAFACMCARAREDYSDAAWDHVMKSFDRMLIQMR